jgi:hypothetical protein
MPRVIIDDSVLAEARKPWSESPLWWPDCKMRKKKPKWEYSFLTVQKQALKL